MKRTLLSRMSGAVVAAALAVTTLSTVVASPAHAAAVCSTTTTFKVSSTLVQYGGYNSLSADVNVGSCSGGSDSYVGDGAGSVRIQRSFDGRNWQTLKVGQYASYVSSYGNGATALTAWYRAYYTGGKESTSYEPSTFRGSASAPVRVSVIRSVTVRDKSKGGHILGRFKITPTAGIVGKKLTFQVKKGKKWKKYKRVKLRGNGIMKVTFKGSRKGIKYRLIVPGAANLSGYTYGPYVARRY
jgi:hypothetical protein